MGSVAQFGNRRGGRRSYSGDPKALPVVPVAIGAALVVVLLVVVLGGRGGQAVAKSEVPQIAGRGNYAPSLRGASAAATAFERYYLVADLEELEVARKKLLALTLPDYQNRISGQLNGLFGEGEHPLKEAKDDGVPFVAKVYPLEYKAKAVNDSQVDVTVWSSTLAGIKDAAVPRVSYSRSQLRMEWTGKTWLLADYKELPAPVPFITANQRGSSDDDFYRAMEGAKSYDDAP